MTIFYRFSIAWHSKWHSADICYEKSDFNRIMIHNIKKMCFVKKNQLINFTPKSHEFCTCCIIYHYNVLDCIKLSRLIDINNKEIQ